MLGQRSVIGEVEKMMNNEDFIIETKIDGERMQVHKMGDEFAYFSRNCIEYTGEVIEGCLPVHFRNQLERTSPQVAKETGGLE